MPHSKNDNLCEEMSFTISLQYFFVLEKVLFSIKLHLWKAVEKILFTQQKYSRFCEMTDRD